MLWAKNEKAPDDLGGGSGALMTPLANGIDMNATSKQGKSQQESAGRRGFLSKAGAIALAAGAVASVSATQVAASVSQPIVTNVVEIEMVGDIGKELANLCKLAAMLSEFVRVNLDVIQEKCPELELELTDFVDDMSAAARTVSKAGGFKVNPKYVEQYGKLCLASRGAV